MVPGIPRCVMFDAGHVLVDVDFGGLASFLKKRAGLEPEQVEAAVVRDGLARCYELGQLSDEEFCDRIGRRLGVNWSRDELVAAWNSVILGPIVPEAVLAATAAKCALWIVSNTNRLHFNHIRQHYPYLRYFQGWILSYEAGVAKPDPAIFRIALARAGVTAGETLFVDDQGPNVASAQSVGIDAVQFVDAGQLAGELRSRGLL